MVQDPPDKERIGDVSRRVIEFVIREYVEATGQQPNVVLDARHNLGRHSWTLSIEITDDALTEYEMRMARLTDAKMGKRNGQ